MYITTKIKSFNPAHGEVYSILHHEMKIGSELQRFDGYPFSSTNRTENVTLKPNNCVYFDKKYIPRVMVL